MSAKEAKPSFWNELMCSSTLRNGVIDGVLLNIAMFAALIAANRMPFLERWALERNAVSGGVFFLVAILPVVRFHRSPRCVFICGMTAWALLSLGYLAAGMWFSQLFMVLRKPLEVLIDGAIGYGVAAAMVWVGSLFRMLRHSSPTPTRRRHHDART